MPATDSAVPARTAFRTGASAAAAASAAIEPGAAQKLIGPVLLELPLFLYGLWLLRGIGKKDKAELLK